MTTKPTPDQAEQLVHLANITGVTGGELQAMFTTVANPTGEVGDITFEDMARVIVVLLDRQKRNERNNRAATVLARRLMRIGHAVYEPHSPNELDPS